MNVCLVLLNKEVHLRIFFFFAFPRYLLNIIGKKKKKKSLIKSKQAYHNKTLSLLLSVRKPLVPGGLMASDGIWEKISASLTPPRCFPVGTLCKECT